MSNKNPFFSIVIPTYNHAHFIGRCLESILSQSFQNWEAIVINNFSDDNTIEIVESYNDPRIHLINNANGGIIAVSRNKGISLSCGEWICFLDSDDWWAPIKLEQILNYINDYDFIYHGMNIVSVKKFILSRRTLNTRQVKDNIACDLLINSNVIPNSSVAIKKSLINLVGYLSEEKELVAVEDLDYWIRVSLVTNKFKYIPKQLGYYWIGLNISNTLNKTDKIDFLHNKYKYLLNSKQLQYANAMLSYNKARLLQHHNYFQRAFSLYFKLIFSTISFRLRINSLLGTLLCVIRCRR